MAQYSFEQTDNTPTLRLQQEQDLKARLLWLYGFFALSILVALFLLAYFARQRLEVDVLATDGVLVQLMAEQLTIDLTDTTTAEADLNAWLAAGGQGPPAAVAVVRPSGNVLLQTEHNLTLAQTTEWHIWQREAVRQVVRAPDGVFISRDPTAARWLHVSRPFMVDGELAFLVLHRPERSAFGTFQVLSQGLVLAIFIFILGGIIFWTYLSGRVIRPLEKLEAFSSLIRWRGRMQPDEQQELEKLARQNDQLGSLARSLLAMDEDIDNRFRQLATLLETGRIVASSLDVDRVMDNILDQVQQLFSNDRSAVIVLDRRTDSFRIRSGRGLSEAYVHQLRIASTEPNSSAMRALRNQEPVQIADTETDLAYAPFRQRAQKEGFRSVLTIPLNTQHAPPAVLLIYKDQPYRYSYTELELAASFGHHASIAMDNATLHAHSDEQLQEQTSRLESIVESLQDGLILEGPTGQVLYCNQQAADLCGLPRRIARQKQSQQLLERLLEQVPERETAVQTVQNAVIHSGTRSFDLAQVLASGHPRDLRISIFDVTDADGQLLGRGQLWQDVTPDKELDRMKSALLSTVSHELRTPLASIKGYASTLLASDVEWDAATQREFLQTISEETDRLTGLVKNLLDMSRIEAGLLDMHCEPFSLNDLLSQVIQGFRPSLDNRLRLTLATDLPPVAMDVPRMGTAVRNLLENAVKYSPPESLIELATRQNNGHVQLTVRDYGPGIPAELSGRIFERFFRADNSLTRREGGTGLGLAICKGFVEAHNGRVWVEDGRPGARFGLALPLAVEGRG